VRTRPAIRRLLLGRSGLLGVTAVLAVALLVVGWLDGRATRRELVGLLEDHAHALRETIAAAARANAAASRLAEAELAERVRNNARMLAALDGQRPLGRADLEKVAAANSLFRVTVFAPDGTRTLSAGIGGYGPGAGAQGGGPGAQQLVNRVLLEGEAEATGEVHSGRRPGAGRLAAVVRRSRGGAILVNADATAVLQLQQQSSLDALLADIVASAHDVAYVVVDVEGMRKWAGSLPGVVEPAPASGPNVDPRPVSPPRETLADGRPVLEFTGPLAGEGEPSRGVVRLGMRLDGVHHSARRFLIREAMSLAAALLLGAVALAYAWMRQRYGRLSEAHQRAQEALRRRDRLAAMGEMASTVAHEIRNPLNAIAMSAQRLQRETFASPDADAESATLVNVIRKEADRIDGRVQQFLAFARPPALRPAPLDIGPWLTSAADAMRAAAAARGIAVEVDVSRAGAAHADAGQLRQVADNLMRNAIDAMSNGGRLSVSATSDESGHRLAFSDEGPGVSADVLPKIFDLYFTTKTGGTGVGLAVAQQIVAAHGGRIEVDSGAGRGATFTVVLPEGARA
jgi:signal transduction histidine kinase